MLRALMFSACALAACAPAAAQQYPNQPIRVIVPFTPGGGTDFLSRTVAAKLSDSVKWNVVAENRPGAGGTIGITTAARAKPDGYEIVMGQVDNLAVAPSLYAKLAYDPVKDFEPIGIVGEAPLVVVANKNGPYKSLQDLIAAAKKAPGTINYGSPGAGTITHLAAELLQLQAGIKLVHVPYKGSGPAMADLLGGQVPIIFTSIPSAAPQIKAGSAVPLAVTSAKRSPAMPDVPTIAESGYPDFDVRVWYGLLAPAKTPKPIIQTLNTELNKILASKDVQDALAAQGATAMPTTPAQFSQTIAADYKKWRAVIQSANVKLE
ncbi:tripartite tricarboxylate transporter substrate binding protein [Achromobacter pestifer]|uniref:Tripartite tricarboxylate transporter substrate binding protein n=1 Tax=Achromobacter pestifer TaxID=1353889 RepID=A0A7D4E3Y8_9BURK|nr:tripartite tricarboxylate transporter substrate binding protein [Achromobacter pestifer]QKH37590.1 tripartite tricarboxylate transporter substrate binding protein [Achromobacter pestifer]